MKKSYLLLVLIGLIALYYKSDAPDNTEKRNTFKSANHTRHKTQLIHTSSAQLKSSASLVSNTLTQAFKHLGYTIIFPFSNDRTTLSSNLDSLQIIANNSQNRKVQTFSRLTNQTPSESSSSFTCPRQLPFATSYTLESSITNIIEYGQIYKNACYDIPKGSKSQSNDLLYGDSQIIDSNGTAANLTAFIPVDAPGGCLSSKNKYLVDISIPESNIIVTPITQSIGTESIVTGFNQTINLNIDCNKVCNHMLNNLCANDWSYCGQTVAASYYRKNTYLAANIQENFCACSIQGQYAGKSYFFTNAVDLENVINYTNRLSSVTCSNYFPDAIRISSN